MQISQKQKDYSHFFSTFFNSELNLERFEKKDNPHRFCLFQITDSRNVIR